MAMLTSFRAWRAPVATEAGSDRPEARPESPPERLTGQLDRRPCFTVLEVPGASASLRALVIEATEPLDALESGHPPPANPATTLVPALAADDDGSIEAELEALTLEEAPEGSWRTVGGVVRAWRIPDVPLSPRAGRLAGLLQGLRVRPLVPTGAGQMLAVVPLSSPGLSIEAMHRGLKAHPTFDEDLFLTLARESARIYEVRGNLSSAAGRRDAMEQLTELGEGRHAVLLVLPGGGGRILRFRQGLSLANHPAAPRSPTLRSLDLALLNGLLLRTVLGIEAPEDIHGHPHIEAEPSLDVLAHRVAGGGLQAGFALASPPLWELRAVLEAGAQLPPGTLVLEPSIPQGLLAHPEGRVAAIDASRAT